jgi:hypothetical protein
VRLLYLFTTKVKLLNKSLKVHQVFEFITHAPSLGSQYYAFARFILVAFNSVFLQVVDVKDIKVIEKFIEFGEDGGKDLYAGNAHQEVEFFVFGIVELGSHLQLFQLFPKISVPLQVSHEDGQTLLLYNACCFLFLLNNEEYTRLA